MYENFEWATEDLVIALKFEVSCEENNAKRIKLFEICIILLNLMN